MRIPFILAYVFTDRPLAGNQLCVVPDSTGLTDDRMQAIASEINFSETTFVTETAGDPYAMRIFTPGGELPFAGHPSLGTAFVLVATRRISSPATQVVKAGGVALAGDAAAGCARIGQARPPCGE